MSSRLKELKVALADKYEIEKELGAGGMATVYLANDVKHQRQVAVKVLRPDLAAALGPDRFLREIRIAANLNHPHILALFDSGEAEGFLYYVMPYIEGQTLRDRIDREGELPVTEAVRVIREVTDALAFAHSKGVVHRDIKPDNVMLTGGHAIVADFGVAKAVSEATGRDKLTTAGVALGTPAYMSPEQATADPHIDHRSDIYAVGAMAYELLAGRTPFIGVTPQSILAAHVTEQAEPVSKHRDQVSPDLDAVIMKCLAKKPADRWQTAGEMLPYLDLAATSSGGLTPTSTVPLSAVSGTGSFLSPKVIGLAVVLATAGIFGSRMLRSDPFVIATSNFQQITSDAGLEFQPSLSTDGADVAFVVGPPTAARVVIRSTVDLVSGGETRPGEGVVQFFPVWNPDGASISYRSCSTFDWVGTFYPDSGCVWKRVGKLGGTSATVGALAGFGYRVAVSADGNRVAGRGPEGIFVQDVGDTLTYLAITDPTTWVDANSFAWSPDGRLLAYANGNSAWTTGGNLIESSIWVVEPGRGEPIMIASWEDMNVSPQWLPDSRHLLFVSDRDGPRGIYAVEVGPDGPVGDVQAVAASTDPHSISVSADGRRLAFSKFQLQQNIWSIAIPSGPVSVAGAQPLTTGNQVIESHGVSVDGEFIAYDGNRLGNADIYIMSVDGGNARQIVDLPQSAFWPEWSPDGTEVVFASGGGIQSVSASGGDPQVIARGGGFPEWSPDGSTIAITAGDRFDAVWTISREGDGWGEPAQLTDFECHHQAWASDGDSLVCVGENGLSIVSNSGELLRTIEIGMAATDPKFSHDGSELYWLTRTGPSAGVWSIPTAGGEATQLVVFDDPRFVPFGELSVGNGRFYLTLAEYESDIWVMDLEY